MPRPEPIPADLPRIEAWAAVPREERVTAAAKPALTLEQALESSDQIADLSRAEPTRALKLAQAFIEMATASGGDAIVAVARRCRGHLFRRLRRHREAIRDYDAARRELERLGLRLESARTAIGMVDALAQMGRYEDAHQLARNARRVFVHEGEEGRAARLDANLATIFERTGRPREALAAYRRAETIFERRGAVMDLALTRFNHANVLVTLDRYGEALSLYRSSAEVWTARGATATLCRCQLAIGSVLFRLGQLHEALASLEEASETAASVDDRELQATAAVDQARAEILLERFDRIAPRLDTAIHEFGGLAMRADQAEALALRGTYHIRTGRPEEALRDWERARQLYHALGHRRGRAWADSRRAEALAKLGREAEGRRLLRSALPTLRREGQAVGEVEARLLLAELELSRRPADAARQLAAVALRMDALKDPWAEYRLAFLRARLAIRVKRPREARRHLERAYAIARRLQLLLPLEALQAHWMERRSEVLDLALHPGLFADNGAGVVDRSHWLLHWSERARAMNVGGRAIARDIAGGARELSAFQAAREELHRLDARERGRRLSGMAGGDSVKPSRELSRWRRQRARVMAALEQHTKRLEMRAGPRGHGVRDLKNEPRSIQRALAPDEVLVEYVARDTELLILLVSRNSIEVVQPGEPIDAARDAAQRLRQLWERYRVGSGFRSRHEESLAVTAGLLLGQLQESLLDPVLERLGPETRRLVVSPHSWLRAVPFHAFPRVSDPAGPGWAVRYTLSGRGLTATTASRASGPPLIVGVSSPDAPRAELEARAVARAHTHHTLLLGEAATPSEVRARWSRSRLIHLAAHGALQADDPRLSGIPLAGGSWTVHELRSVTTRADLVVLSSCQSGETVLWTTDHQVGLLPALFESGARSAVVSLWPADDECTGMFMAAFHHEVASGQSLGEAIQSARKVIRTVKPSPYYWAPFVLYGADSRRESTS